MVLSGDLLSVMWRRDDGAIVLVCLCGGVLVGIEYGGMLVGMLLTWDGWLCWKCLAGGRVMVRDAGAEVGNVVGGVCITRRPHYDL